MRKSVERGREDAEARYRRQNRRLLLWSLVPMTAVACLVWLGAHFYDAQTAIAQIEREQATREAEFPKVLAALEERRKIREADENSAIRTDIYERTIAGDSAPPELDAKRCNYLRKHHLPDQTDVFVSKNICVWPLTFEPELTEVYGVQLRPDTAEAFQQLEVDASSAGYTILATSGYRSFADQAATYLFWYSNQGYDVAESHSAYPGYSEHQTGLAVDVSTPGCALDCFATTDAYAWMVENSHRYGFIERYPEDKSEITGYNYEPWHWRYVGVETATKYHEQAAPTLENFWQLATE